MAVSTQVFVAGERVLATLWVGALWAIGYLAVPTLFASLDDRMLAGMIAGKLFTAVSFIGLGCGTALLVGAWMRAPRPATDLLVRLIGAMVLMILVGEFLLQPQMAALKAEGLVEGSGAAARFGVLHGVASLLYLANSLCGLWLLVLQVRPQPLRAGV